MNKFKAIIFIMYTYILEPSKTIKAAFLFFKSTKFYLTINSLPATLNKFVALNLKFTKLPTLYFKCPVGLWKARHRRR